MARDGNRPNGRDVCFRPMDNLFLPKYNDTIDCEPPSGRISIVLHKRRPICGDKWLFSLMNKPLV